MKPERRARALAGATVIGLAALGGAALGTNHGLNATQVSASGGKAPIVTGASGSTATVAARSGAEGTRKPIVTRSSTSAGAAAPVDEAVIAAIRELNPARGDAIVARVVSAYLASVPDQLEELRAGLEASDAEALRFVAHALKSSSGNVGARAVQEQAALLEQDARAGELGRAKQRVERLEEEWLRACGVLLGLAGAAS